MLGRIYNFIILLMWVFLIYKLSNKRGATLIGCLLGIFACSFLLIPYIRNTISSSISNYYLLGFYTLTEEVIKYIFIFIFSVYFMNEIDDLSVIGISAGLGFAFAETHFLYYKIAANVLRRGRTSYILHMTTGYISSLGIKKHHESKVKKWLLLFLLSFVIHYIYNIAVIQYSLFIMKKFISGT